jgi:hypothetical protein
MIGVASKILQAEASILVLNFISQMCKRIQEEL